MLFRSFSFIFPYSFVESHMVVKPSEFSLVVGINNASEVWNTLEQRFALTLRANILNLKIELQSIKKGTDTINGFF